MVGEKGEGRHEFRVPVSRSISFLLSFPMCSCNCSCSCVFITRIPKYAVSRCFLTRTRISIRIELCCCKKEGGKEEIREQEEDVYEDSIYTH